MLLGEPLPKRQKVLSGLQGVKGRRPYFEKFQDREIELQVHTVEIGLPKYRLNNGRTLAAQEAWLARHPDLPRDLFTKDHEADQAQEEQHKVLEEMLDEEDLYAFFKNSKNKQDDPLILSSNGFVVNGNRRLCAMRKLYDGDSEEYSHFAHIDVVVLPPADDKALYELEAKLQVKPDIQSRYKWLQQAKMLKKGRDVNNLSDEELSRINGLRKERVQELLALLQTADKYLAEKGQPGRYDLVEKGEYAFRKIRESRERFREEGKRNVFEKLAYVMFENPEGQGRSYATIPAISEHYDKIIARIEKEVPLEIPPSATGALDLLGGNNQSALALALTVKKPENADVIRDIITDVLDSERTRAKEQINADSSLKRVTEANNALAEAFNFLDRRSTTEGMTEHLRAIEFNLKRIRDWLKAHGQN